MQAFWWDDRDDDLVVAPCAHGALWQARDRIWRCERCEPPFWFEEKHGGVIARTQRFAEQLELAEAAA